MLIRNNVYTTLIVLEILAITALAACSSGTQTQKYSVGGSLSGLASGNSIVLQINGTDNLTQTSNGTFIFPTSLPSGTAYSASILTQTALQPCTSTYNAGTINSSNVTNIHVICGPAFIGVWNTTGSMAEPRVEATSTLLPNGQVLVAGGLNGASAVSSAELYDPLTGLWASTGSMAESRVEAAATLLPNGKVLVAGGYNGASAVPSAECRAVRSLDWTMDQYR